MKCIYAHGPKSLYFCFPSCDHLAKRLAIETPAPSLRLLPYLEKTAKQFAMALCDSPKSNFQSLHTKIDRIIGRKCIKMKGCAAKDKSFGGTTK